MPRPWGVTRPTAALPRSGRRGRAGRARHGPVLGGCLGVAATQINRRPGPRGNRCSWPTWRRAARLAGHRLARPGHRRRRRGDRAARPPRQVRARWYHQLGVEDAKALGRPAMTYGGAVLGRQGTPARGSPHPQPGHRRRNSCRGRLSPPPVGRAALSDIDRSHHPERGAAALGSARR
jgi:hypothetical protein